MCVFTAHSQESTTDRDTQQPTRSLRNSMPPLPPAAEAARLAAARSQSRRNMAVAGAIVSFVGGVFFYSVNAVGTDDAITEWELQQFRQQRERQRQLEAARK